MTHKNEQEKFFGCANGCVSIVAGGVILLVCLMFLGMCL
jgi:hypothetical protein